MRAAATASVSQKPVRESLGAGERRLTQALPLRHLHSEAAAAQPLSSAADSCRTERTEKTRTAPWTANSTFEVDPGTTAGVKSRRLPRSESSAPLFWNLCPITDVIGGLHTNRALKDRTRGRADARHLGGTVAPQIWAAAAG